jgi:16S rRNA (cytidine1402-2'-O)-methyltransferase
MHTGILYIVATPIGNLEDITYRAVRILKEADLIFCEDTRVTKKLLDHYRITAETRSFYKSSGNGARKPEPNFEYILSELKSGKNVAFVTDAGTPGISDPGNTLAEKVLIEGIAVVPIPGVSALTTLASVSGIDLSQFVFLGFPPHKKGRETYFHKLIAYDLPVIYYESPHRLIKNMELLLGMDLRKNIIIGRELTKMFEEIIRGDIGDVLKYFSENKDRVRGEMVIIVY